ncbi:MAG: GxxExxY protein [Sedimentisphaerales bacterium]|nr:GxxExxY protein [Sedimentisphaerales bacterium]
MADDLTERIIGAAIEAHRELGPGLLESIYEEALCFEFDLQGISYLRQVPVDMIYKGHAITGHKLDLLVAGEVVVEIKAQKTPPGMVISQTISYLKAANLKLGLIINFSENRLIDGVKRVSM